MLKRILIFFIVLFLSLFIVKNPLYSQEPPVESSEPTFNEVYKVYIEDSIDEYNMAHDEYLLRRSQHLKFDSQKSRQEAFDATLLMLEKRDNVVISYLNVLEVRLKESIGVSDSRKSELLLKIDDEIEWFTYHRDNLTTTGSLEDLVKDSNLASSRWLRIDPLAYEVMSVISQGKVNRFSENLDELFGETKDKLEIIRNDKREGYSFSREKFEIIDRWAFEVDGIIVRSKEKQNEAELLIQKIRESKDYNQVVVRLTDAQLHMKRAISFLKEIIEQVKIQE